MMWPLAALSVVLAASAFASSVTTLPLVKLQRTRGYLEGSLEAARARVAYLERRAANGPTTEPAVFLAPPYLYTTRVGIGNPPTYYNLVVDSGSSNIFCGAGIPYVRTPTSIPTGQNLSIKYVTASITGKEYLDQVTLGPNLVITNQSIGDALSIAGLEGADGILGFGPIDLTQATLSPDQNATIPTVMNNLVSQGLIEKQVLGLYLSPVMENGTSGALTYGGADPCLYEGELTYVPVTKTFPSSFYWGINITSCTYGPDTIIPTSVAGIVDSGSNGIFLADDFFKVYMNAIPGATLDPTTGYLEIPLSSIPSMQPLRFVIGDQTFILDVDAQLIPSDWSELPGKRYGAVMPLQIKSGQGLDFILGTPFMERYYMVFDADAQRVGIARANNSTSSQGY